MEGVGVPLVTPFDEDGGIDESKLRAVASWVVECGVDFVVPCGSNGESELMTLEERAEVTEIVADEVSVPVLAGTGHPGFEETREQTRRAAEAGADAALVVTPYYFEHDQAALAAYYRRLADESPLPIYLYNVPAKTGVSLDPETVGAVADHENVAGMKDSTGDMIAFQRERRLAGPDFDLLVGTGALLAPALDAGGDGGVMALANVVPDLLAEVYRQRDDGPAARALNSDLVALNQAITAKHGVPGLKAAMAHRDVPAGHVRFPHRAVDEDVVDEVAALVDKALDGHAD
ncbi:dihydrodipicolinate synthase family protein [Halococcus sp. IIIV-5B]|uniref:dihydrodipicolinate synthase family protein n=1 Tax=Halococcus sp. IIIV-5B TaxID=2321230 RepID=UPI000E715299|nr:dihydrodipicolinate synthase family protein [Halococcus sp. IIIV-5B]RJT04852.1 dihydrodipicolinate synthase family protein [Halococcus sp. IIIV-5B]